MGTTYIVIVFVFFFSVLAVTGWALFKMSPFAHHADHYRDEQGNRIESPHL